MHMRQLSCVHCGASFSTYNKGRKYCGRECFAAAKTGEKRPETARKIAMSLKGHKLSEQTKDKIRQKALTRPSEGLLTLLYEMWEMHLSDAYILSHVRATFSPISARLYTRLKQELHPGTPQIPFIQYSRLNYQQFRKLLEFSRGKMSHKRIARSLNIGEKVTLTTLKKLEVVLGENLVHSIDQQTYKYSQKETWIEKKIRLWLIDQGISFSREVSVHEKESNKRYRFDFEILGEKIFIEAQGDFWHANPGIYQNLTAGQIAAVQRDQDKLKCAHRLGYRCLYIWENDLKNKPETILQELKDAIRNNQRAIRNDGL